ncbi:MAG: DUF3418 domain-containing protein, partial [Planctomycetes bacterium]|nr:DUF3418 domain-containing protein [Planctomycetota bacterium]
MKGSRKESYLRQWQRLRDNIQVPEHLPIADKVPELIELLQSHDTVIVAGETGSGKTTQVPKICLMAGLAKEGRVMVTQPRRLAATRTAMRIAEECGVEVGEGIGYRIRFQHKSNENSCIEVVTDGIPLSGNLAQRPFQGCDVVIVDEVHERSVNIDLLLGLLKLEREKGSKLKIILMSATLDTQSYQKFFPEAKLFEVEGRTFPVELFYEKPDDGTLAEQLSHSIREWLNIGFTGDALCFLPTERDIRESEKVISKMLPSGFEVLPLFSRLSQADQDRVFRKGGKRKIILSTNIAETSITLSGVKIVFDTGFVRMLHYMPGRDLPVLKVERVSKASAKQRMGRAGRISPGKCVRLYAGNDYQTFDEFTIPEIKRQDLALVILKLVAMGFRNPQEFHFVDKPLPKAFKSGIDQLLFLNALRQDGDDLRITGLGKKMVRLPLSPRLAHMMIQGEKENLLGATAVLAAFLSIQDPRQNPVEELKKARASHLQWQVEGSDFMGVFFLYETYLKKETQVSKTALKKWCHSQYLSPVRMRDWKQLSRELQSMLKRSPSKNFKKPPEDNFHQLILGSHLDSLLEKDEKANDGSYHSLGRKAIFVHPSSSLNQTKCDWAVCTAFLNTSRLFALNVAKVQVEWVLEKAAHLLVSVRGEARYDERSEKVVSEERLFFKGHLLKSIPSKDHFPVDPEKATEVFIREALLAGKVNWRPLQQNEDLLKQLQNLDSALRVRSAYCNEDRLIELYVKKLGHCSRVSDLKKKNKHDITLSFQECMDEEWEALSRDYPMQVQVIPDELSLPLSYHYLPGQKDDGVHLPLKQSQLGGLTHSMIEYGVPAYFQRRLEIAWEQLPKDFKKHFVQEDLIKVWQEEYLANENDVSLLDFFRHWMLTHTSTQTLVDEWLGSIQKNTPNYFIIKLIVLSQKGKELYASRDLVWLRGKCKAAMGNSLVARYCREKEKVVVSHYSQFDVIELAESSLAALKNQFDLPISLGLVEGEPLEVYPCLYLRAKDLWYGLRKDREEAHKTTMLTLAQIVGPVKIRDVEFDSHILSVMLVMRLELGP